MNGINVTQRLQWHLDNPQFLMDKSKLDSFENYSLFKVVMPRMDSEVYLAVKLKQEDELLVEKMYYATQLSQLNLAILDAYVSICQGRPVEAIDRLTSKEIDFYLRDNSKQATFDFYPSELYDILSIGEELKKIAFGTTVEIRPHLDTNVFGIFKDLSYSEQLELVEDILGEYYFTKYPKLAGRLVCEDILDEKLIFSLKQESQENLEFKNELLELFSFHLQFRPKVIINLIRS